MGRASLFATLFALALVVFMVALCPAAYVLRQAEAHSGNRLAAFEENGSAWAGSARIAFSAPTGVVTLERLDWRFNPMTLLAGRLGFDATARMQDAQLRAGISRGFEGWQLRDARAEGSARAFATLAPLAMAWKPEGRLEMTSPRIAFDGRVVEGQADVTWRDASLALSSVKPLGTYRLEMVARSGTPASLTLATVSGPLQVAGRGTWTLPSSISLSGEARAEGPLAAQLEPVLDLIGPKRPDGARALELRSR
jgi:general secretion pathway protein N